MGAQNGDPPSITLVDLERLYNIQEEFSDATSLGIITVDARGIPVTRDCGFSEFCLEIRKDPIRRMRCYSCDAHGGLQAAIEGRPHIYRCHTGLIDFSVPIIIDDQYVGAILCGQVKIDQGCDDPEFLMSYDQAWSRDEKLRDLFEGVPATSIRRVEGAAATLLILSQEIVHKATSSTVIPLGLSSKTPEDLLQDYSVEALKHTHASTLTGQDLADLRSSLNQEDLPREVAAIGAYLDHLFAECGHSVTYDQMSEIHEELLSFSDIYGPLVRQAMSEAIKRHPRRQRPHMDRYACHVHVESLLYILHDAANRAEPNRRPTMAWLLNRIERYPTRPWTLKEAAAYLGVSLSHASKTFKTYTGQNFVTYVSHKKIERAKLMVAYTNHPIVRIARELGFLPNYFSRVFRTKTGLSPSEYREQYWGATH